MKYIVGYYGNNKYVKNQLSKYSDSKREAKITYFNISDMDKDLIEATSFNGLIFDTAMHENKECDEVINYIINSNPDLDIMPIISKPINNEKFDVNAKAKEEAMLIKEKSGTSTIPYLVESNREAELFMITIFSALSDKTIRNMEEIENYKLDSRENMLKALKSVVIALELKDPYTRDHSRRVANYAVQIAMKLGLSDNKVSEIEEAGWLHDIGKLAINDPVLLKSGKLTDSEFTHMKSHVVIGNILLNNIFPSGEFENVKDYAKHHHERYDGKGYPDNIEGENISLGARILCLADSFDAMTTQRSYNKPKKLDEAILDLQKNSGTQFDPEVASTFIALLKQEPEKLKETLGISVDSDGYIQVAHGPKIDKENIKENNNPEENKNIEI